MSQTIEIGEALTLRDDTGLKVIDVGLRATFYFRNGHTIERRRAVAACLDEFVGMAAGALRWTIPTGLRPAGSSMEEAAAKLAADLTADDFDEEDGWEFGWHGGETVDAASNLMIDAYGVRSWQAAPPHNDLSLLTVMFPLTFFTERETGLPTLVTRWASHLGALHGYGGIGLALSPDRFVMSRYGAEIIGFGMRFPGLEVDYPLHHSIWCKERIKGGNWLTVLSSELLDKAGGVEQLADTLGEPFVFTGYSGGTLIRAGSAPEVGDRNRQIDTPHYARLARALKPIRIQIHGPVHGISREEFEAWLARFDN
jgi:hypothetical protein